jgi:hypothetical protein
MRSASISSIASMTWNRNRPAGGGGVDSLLEHNQIDATVSEQRSDLGEMAYGARYPGQPGDD